MRGLVNELYWEVLNDLDKIHKSKLLLSERVALEKAIVKLEAIKKIIGFLNMDPQPNK